MLSINEVIRKNFKRWLGISDPQDANDITLTRKLTREEEIFLYKIITAGDGFDIENAFKQVYDDGFHFWTAKKDRKHPVCKRHSGLPNTIVSSIHDIVTECYEGTEIEDSEAAELWKEVSNTLKTDNKIIDMVDDVIVTGDAVMLIDLFEEKNGFPKIRIEDAQNVLLVDNTDPDDGIILLTHYFDKNKKYLLEETRKPGEISWKLFEGDKEVPLSTLKETAALEAVNPYRYGYFITNEEGKKELISSGTFKTYEFLKFRNSKKYKGRGASYLESKIDAVDGLDLTVSSFAQNTVLAWPRIFVPETNTIHKNGEADIEATIFNSFYKKPILNAEKIDSNTELLQASLLSSEYSNASTYWTEIILQGFISCSTIGLNALHYNSDDDIREREKTTLYTYNAIKKMLQSSIPAFIVDYIQFYNYKNHKNIAIEQEHIMVNMDEYSNPSFEVQVQTIGQAVTTGIMSIEAAVDELYGATKDQIWKDEEIARLKAEKEAEKPIQKNPEMAIQKKDEEKPIENE